MSNEEIEVISESPLGNMIDNTTIEKMENSKEMIAFFLTLAKEGIISKEEARFLIGLPSKYKRIKFKYDSMAVGSMKKISFNKS